MQTPPSAETPNNVVSLDVIAEILAHLPEVAVVHVIEFPMSGLLQDRFEPTPEESLQISQALALRDQLGMPFWDSLLLTFVSRGGFSDRLLAMIRAHHNQNRPVRLPADSRLLKQHLDQRQGANIAFSSKVELNDGCERHIPMLDFHCPNGIENLALAKSVLRQLGMTSGYLLESGDSYHFYGRSLLDRDDLVRFLGLALHYSPIIDRAWIGHQLRELACALRITPKHGVIPQLVHALHSRIGETRQ